MIADTNLILRSLDRLASEHGDAARARIRVARETGERIAVLSATLLEVDFALASLSTGYGWDKPSRVDALRSVLGDSAYTVEHAAALDRALDVYESRSIDLHDCLLAALAQERDTKVLSFDRDLDKLGVAERP